MQEWRRVYSITITSGGTIDIQYIHMLFYVCTWVVNVFANTLKRKYSNFTNICLEQFLQLVESYLVLVALVCYRTPSMLDSK